MNQTITAVYDGSVLHPDSVLKLQPNSRYIITIQELPSPSPSTESDAWDVLDISTGIITAPADWAVEHDHYLYGTPKNPKNE